jgi:16S rRNA (guanine527-N7)-methyltransferase
MLPSMSPILVTSSALASDRERALALTPVSRETADRLDTFVDLLLRWQEKLNLIAPSTIPELWTRHIADSLQLLPLAPSARRWVDFGTGGGFPGLVLACALREKPGAVVHLVESNGKKAAFLRQVARQLSVPALVHSQRINDFVASFKDSADVVTARAVAPLRELVGLAAPLLSKGAQGLFLKGRDVEAELIEASKYWSLTVELVPSRTEADGRIVVVRAAERKEPVSCRSGAARQP